MSAKTAVELIARCREQIKNQPEGEAFMRLLLAGLAQEHGVRCVLLKLPSVSDTCLLHVTVLFAVLFSRFMGAKGVSLEVLDRVSFSPVPETPSLAEASRYLDQLLALREAIQRVLIPEETDAARTADSENVRLFLSRSQEFIRVLETVRTCYGVRGVVTENRIAVRDWWYTLESYPALSQEILAAVRQQMAKIPVQLADVHLENVETVLFAEGFRRLPEALQHDVVCVLPVLLLDGEAFDNFAWMLTENAFATGGNWVSHSDLMNQVDVLRCFILQGTEFLMQIAHMLSTLDRQAQQPFWDLLNLEALNRAAALSVGVDTHRLKTVMGALRRSNLTRAKHVSHPQSVRSKTA